VILAALNFSKRVSDAADHFFATPAPNFQE
jgi:hypothetical protein